MSHRHLISVVKGCSYPNQIICLDVDGILSAHNNNPSRQIETLSSWHGIGISGVGGVYNKRAELSGTDVESLWQSLSMRLRRGGVIWVFSERASRVWTLLGLWERIEDGHCRILGNETRQSGVGNQGSVPGMQEYGIRDSDGCGRTANAELHILQGASRMHGNGEGNAQTGVRRKPNGVCILEDPPIVIDVRITGLPGRMRILDVFNYGLLPSAKSTTANERTQRAVRFVTGMIDTLREERLGSLKTTSAGQAVNAWKYAHFKHPVLCHNDARATNLEEECYYGGRCEASHIGQINERIYHLDVSSMYTSICAGADLPSCLAGYSDTPTVLCLDSLLQEKAVLASVSLGTDSPFYPYHCSRSNLTIWPVGEFTTSLAGPELEHAHKMGYIRRWHKVAWYDRSPFLASFALHCLRLRERNVDNPDIRHWAKSLGVAVVGKLGQRSRYWQDDTIALFHKAWDSFYVPNEMGEPVRWRSIAGFTQRECTAGFSYDAVPAAAAWVTSLGRMLLLRLILAAGRHNVVYCDTDSLMVLQPGYDNLHANSLIREGQAGELRIVDVWDNVCINGIKDYIGGGKHVQAGKPLEALQEGWPTGQAWITPRLRSACFSKRRPEPVRVAIPFDKQAVYRHGVVLPDGSVVPHFLG